MTAKRGKRSSNKADPAWRPPCTLTGREGKDVLYILGWIVFGLIVGIIAKLLVPGRDPGGFFLTALIGIPALWSGHEPLFERWLDWSQSSPLPGGCLFVQASVELDDRPGSVRERLVGIQRQWLGVIATSLQKGIEAGAFHDGADPEQFAHDVYGVMLAYHHASRLLHDPRAETRARRAFETLVAAARAAH